MVPSTSISDIILSYTNPPLLLSLLLFTATLHSHMNIQHNLQATCKHLNVCPISDCSIAINNDLPEPQPLLLIPGGCKDGHGFYFSEGADGIVTLATGQKMLLACPGNTNGSTTQILDSELHWQPVILAIHFMLTQFLITSRTLHVKVTLSILQDILLVHITTAQNFILRSGLKSNPTFTKS